MVKIYSDEEFDKQIRKSLQQDPTDYDEVTARIKTKIDDEKNVLRDSAYVTGEVLPDADIVMVKDYSQAIKQASG